MLVVHNRIDRKYNVSKLIQEIFCVGKKTVQVKVFKEFRCGSSVDTENVYVMWVLNINPIILG